MLRFAFIAALLGSSVSGADFFPLQEGNTWTYREARFGGSFTITVGAAVAQNDKTYYPLSGYVGQQVLVRRDDQGNLLYADPDTGAESVLTYFTPLDSGPWEAPLRLCGEQAQAQSKGGMVEIVYQTLTCADAGDMSEQYLPAMGMVRRVTQSFTGPRQYDLVHAKVGGTALDTLPTARFSLTAEDQPDKSTVAAGLRLQTNATSAVTLHFATGQEYDLVLSAPDGSVVWKWSAGKAFTDIVHDRTVNGEWSTTVAVPRPAAGTYTLQAWITTMGDKPQFAASIPVTIGQ